jgi:hypothetical protein
MIELRAPRALVARDHVEKPLQFGRRPVQHVLAVGARDAQFPMIR